MIEPRPAPLACLLLLLAAGSAAALPMRFVPNAGQAPEDVRFQVRASGHAVFVTDAGLVLAYPGAEDGCASASVSLELVGARPDLRPEPLEVLPGPTHVLRGSDPDAWLWGLPTYSGVAYREAWPGIDVLFTGEAGRLKREVLVRPGADPEQVRFRFVGATPRLGAGGNLMCPGFTGERFA